MPTIKQSVEQKFVDMATGQVIQSQENITKNWGTEPPFIKLYLQDILFLSDLPKAHNAILLALLKRSGWANEGMEVSLTAGTKRLILKELDLKNIRTINNALSDFVRTKILFRIEVGVYRFNPYLFGKGDWQDISKLRLTIEYNLDGKTFGSTVSYKKPSTLSKSATEPNLFQTVSNSLQNEKIAQNDSQPITGTNKKTKTRKRQTRRQRKTQNLKQQSQRKEA